MNKIILAGNLTKSPELRRTQNGKARVTTGIAVNRRYSQNEVDFFNVVAWEKTAEFIAKYFEKGSRIIIEGRLQNNNYKDSNGTMHYSVDVIVENVEFGGGKGSGKQAEKSKDTFSDDLAGEEIPDSSVPF